MLSAQHKAYRWQKKYERNGNVRKLMDIEALQDDRSSNGCQKEKDESHQQAADPADECRFLRILVA